MKISTVVTSGEHKRIASIATANEATIGAVVQLALQRFIVEYKMFPKIAKGLKIDGRIERFRAKSK